MSRLGRKRAGSRDQSEPGDALQAQRREKMRLFMQDFLHQGKQIIADLKQRGQTLVSTTEKAFAVELLKMPTAIRQMKRKDFINIKGDKEAAVAAIMEFSIDDTSIMKVENTRRGKVKTTRAVDHPEKGTKTRAVSTSTKSRALQKVSRTKFGGSSISSGNNKQTNSLPRSTCATPIMKSCKKAFSSTAIGTATKGTPQLHKRVFETPILKSQCSTEKIQNISLNGSQLSLDMMVPLVNIPLADGQILCSTGDDLETIDVELIHGDTAQHIHNLASQLRALCGKMAANQLHGNTL
ncbi:borealin-2-like isoform X2 [Rhinatrema bivittatum]|uniref:borealin-2-like isoform X2 n=1 Tax=Rhinatrema bivittatum TaxID=194408 RepID=UPI00112B7F78|nr:borealin-2-like isoform X2 [Rhinatrema bivittatum]